MNYDSSRWKWCILFSCHGTKFLNIGLRKSFGVLLTTLHYQLDTPVWILGLVISISISVGDFIGPVVGGIGKKYGCRPVVIIGGTLLSAGMILASLSRSVLQLAIFLCGLCGLGFGLTNDPPFAVLGQYFKEHFSLANSFAMAGSSIGIMVLGPLTQIFVDIYGWRGAMWLIGALVFHITVFGTLLRPLTRKENLDELLIRENKLEDVNPEDESDNHQSTSSSSCSDCCFSLIKTTDYSLLRDPMFITISLVTITIRFSQMAWLIYLVPNVISKGVPPLKASFISTSAGFGDMIGRLLPGVLGSLAGYEIQSKTVWTLGMFITALSFTLDAMVPIYTGMLMLGFFQGLGVGMSYSSTNVVLYDEFGQERLVNSMGWVRGVSGIGRVIGGFVPGFIYRSTHSYTWSYIVLGVIQTLGIVLLNVGQLYFPPKTTT